MFEQNNTANLTEAQKKDFKQKYEQGLNQDKVKSALHSVDMSLGIFGGGSKISLMERPISRFVFHTIFSNPKVESFFRRCHEADTYITSDEFAEFEKICQELTVKISKTSIEQIFLSAAKLPHTNVDLWVIEADWRDLTARITWTPEMEAAVEQQMAGIFNHLERLRVLSTRDVQYYTLGDILTGEAAAEARANEALMEASCALLRQHLLSMPVQQHVG
jgi:hypothetical protein